MRRLALIGCTLGLALVHVSNVLGMTRFVGGQTVRGDNVTPVASAARTTSSNSGTLNAGAIGKLSLLLDVTAASGTSPTLNVSIEESDDGTTWRSVAAFAQKTGVSNERKSFVIAADYYRVVWTIGGTTPSFTFTVSGYSKP